MKKLLFGTFLVLLLLGCQDESTTESETDEEKNSDTSEISCSLPIEPFGPIGTAQQLTWQDEEMALFVHFSINTYNQDVDDDKDEVSDIEWGTGKENPAIFNPTKLNTDEWSALAKEIGFKQIIITAKHHVGFCLWPSKYTEFSLKNSPYKDGKGDIVKDLSESCRRYGLRFGFYLSPWDRNNVSYGTPNYNDYFVNQLTELLTNYGEVNEVWFDGAKGKGVDQEYDFNSYWSTVDKLQPNALTAIAGQHIKWVGNEYGYASEEEWSLGDKNWMKPWLPSECDVSIRPGWFYHDSQDSQVKTVDHLVDIYFKSIGRNSNLLLNVATNKDGEIPAIDKQRLRDWRKKLDEIFKIDLFYHKKIVASNSRNNSTDYAGINCVDNNRKTFWSSDSGVIKADLTIDLGVSKKINIVKLEEAIEYGQRVKTFSVYAFVENDWVKVTGVSTIGRTRLLKFPEVLANKIKVVIEDSKAAPTLRTLSGYYHQF